jgi:hypothetical protein
VINTVTDNRTLFLYYLEFLVVDDSAVTAHRLYTGLAEEVERLHLVFRAVLYIALTRVLQTKKIITFISHLQN